MFLCLKLTGTPADEGLKAEVLACVKAEVSAPYSLEPHSRIEFNAKHCTGKNACTVLLFTNEFGSRVQFTTQVF